MADDGAREFVWINTDWLYEKRIHNLGVHAEVLLITLATFAARGDPPGTLTADCLAEVFRLHTSGPDADEVDPEEDLRKLVDAGFVERDDAGGVRMTAPPLFVYADDPGADVHLMSAAKQRRKLREEHPDLFE